MKFNSLAALCLALSLTHCRDTNDFDLDKDPLKGTIGGASWDYTAGKGQFHPLYPFISGLLLASNLDDPCGIQVTTENHIALSFPTELATYNLPFFQSEYYITFISGGGTVRASATSGFLQVVSISGTEVIGYLSADFDDKNNVQGSFVLQVCN